MTNRQVLSLATSLAAPVPAPGTTGEVFSSAPLPQSPGHLLGRDSAGCLAFLIAIDPSAPLEAAPPVRLENLSVTHAAQCTVATDDGRIEVGIFSIVRCLSQDPRLVELFVDLMAPVSQRLAVPVSAGLVSEVIGRVIQIFRDLAKASERSVQGLWAELFLIAGASRPVAVAQAWHVDAFERFDFAMADQRLEVKSTSGPARVHTFAAAQLRVPQGTVGCVASVVCQRSSGGMSVQELWNVVRKHLFSAPEVLLRVDGVVVRTLGDAWQTSLDLRYDWQSARESLRFYDMAAIPSVGVDAPPGVTEIHFRSDLRGVEPLSPAEVRSRGGLVADASLL